MNNVIKKYIGVILSTILLIGMQSCQEKDSNINAGNVINYISQSVFEESDDGWYYYFIIETLKDGSRSYYEFNAVNLKHREIPNYVINGYNEDGNVVETMLPIPVSLYNGPDTKSDIKKISEFFNANSPNSVITIEDMKFLEVKTISKEIIMDCFNRAITSEPEQLGDYKNKQICNVIQESRSIDGYIWQVGYYLNYGNIKVFNIEIIYDDGTYLSDINNDKTKKIIDVIESMEIDIVNNQSFDIDLSKYQLDNDIDFTRLVRLINLI